MVGTETILDGLEIFFSGATVFSALLLLGYLAFVAESDSLGAPLLGVLVLLLALVVAAGSWYESRWLRLASWPATFVLLALGFVGIAVGPQIIGVAGFALLATIVVTLNDRSRPRRQNSTS